MYVIDTYSVLEFDRVLPSGQLRLDAIDALSKLVTDGELGFPDAVLKDCRTYAGDEVGSMWVISVAGSRKVSSFPGSMPMQVLRACPDLLAVEDAGDQSQIEVACLAQTCLESGADVVVVTEDPGIGGNRITLGDACDQMNIPHCGVKKMLADLGLV